MAAEANDFGVKIVAEYSKGGKMAARVTFEYENMTKEDVLVVEQGPVKAMTDALFALGKE